MPRALGELEEELDAGRITEEEYAAERAALLGLPAPDRTQGHAALGESKTPSWTPLQVASPAAAVLSPNQPPAPPASSAAWGNTATAPVGQVMGTESHYPAPQPGLVHVGQAAASPRGYEDVPVVGSCGVYNNDQDPRWCVPAYKNGRRGCRTHVPNLARTKGRIAFAGMITVFVLLACTGVIVNLARGFFWRDGGGQDDYDPCDAPPATADCGLKWCSEEFDYGCAGDIYYGFNTFEACEGYWQTQKEEQAAGCVQVPAECAVASDGGVMQCLPQPYDLDCQKDQLSCEASSGNLWICEQWIKNDCL